MRILLDESVPERLGLLLVGHIQPRTLKKVAA
jgi:hypothetical protein